MNGKAMKPALYDNVNEILKKSVITKGFEQLHAVPVSTKTEKTLRRERKIEREKTKGGSWFNLPKTKVTEDIHRDLEVLKMRSALDPKHFYKKNDMKAIPKYFQVGHVIDSPLDFYNSRIPMKQRRKTIVEELMADAEVKKYSKRKFGEIIKSNPKLKRKAHQHARKLKRMKR